MSLWGLSIVAGGISAVVLVIGYASGAGPQPADWLSAAATGAVHIVYLSLLGRAFAEGDVVFASDAPFDPEKGPMYIRETIKILDNLEISEEDRAKIYHGNAQKLLGLKA